MHCLSHNLLSSSRLSFDQNGCSPRSYKADQSCQFPHGLACAHHLRQQWCGICCAPRTSLLHRRCSRAIRKRLLNLLYSVAPALQVRIVSRLRDSSHSRSWPNIGFNRRHSDRSCRPRCRIIQRRVLGLPQCMQKLVSSWTPGASVCASIDSQQLHGRVHHSNHAGKFTDLKIGQPAVDQKSLRALVFELCHRLSSAGRLPHLPAQPGQRRTQTLPEPCVCARQHHGAMDCHRFDPTFI